MLLGVDGVCIISHGSSSSTAIVNALRVADETAAFLLRDLITADRPYAGVLMLTLGYNARLGDTLLPNPVMTAMI